MNCALDVSWLIRVHIQTHFHFDFQSFLRVLLLLLLLLMMSLVVVSFSSFFVFFFSFSSFISFIPWWSIPLRFVSYSFLLIFVFNNNSTRIEIGIAHTVFDRWLSLWYFIYITVPKRFPKGWTIKLYGKAYELWSTWTRNQNLNSQHSIIFGRE